MLRFLLAALVALPFLTNAAQAVTVEYNGGVWDFYTVTGTYVPLEYLPEEDLAEQTAFNLLLEGQVWRNGGSLEEASRVAFEAGIDGVFMVQGLDDIFFMSHKPTADGIHIWLEENERTRASTLDFIVAEQISEVPLPASSLLMLTGLLAFVARRRR